MQWHKRIIKHWFDTKKLWHSYTYNVTCLLTCEVVIHDCALSRSFTVQANRQSVKKEKKVTTGHTVSGSDFNFRQRYSLLQFFHFLSVWRPDWSFEPFAFRTPRNASCCRSDTRQDRCIPPDVNRKKCNGRADDGDGADDSNTRNTHSDDVLIAV